MDFSSYANTLDEPFENSVDAKVLRPRIRIKPQVKQRVGKNQDGTVRQKRSGFEQTGLEIFHLREGEAREGVEVKAVDKDGNWMEFQGPQYWHVYKKDKFIERALASLRASKISTNSRPHSTRFSETFQVYPSQHPTQHSVLSPSIQSRLKQTPSKSHLNQKRCQTAESIRDSSTPSRSTRIKDSKPAKRELLPQTKASLSIKLNLNLSSLSIQGKIKDFTIRQLKKIRCLSQSPKQP